MIIVGSCIADGSRFAEVAAPFLAAVLHSEDVILTDDGTEGICRAYNRFIDEALNTPDCEALVLMHDDVEIHDPDFRAKIVNALRSDDVAAVGAIGGLGLKNLEWWDARDTAGTVFETRGPLIMKRQSGNVDVLDGLLMALSPEVLPALRFDEDLLPAFHGYDIDICLQARALGKQVCVRQLDLFHRTRGGYGNKEQFDAASAALTEKWPDWIRPDPKLTTLRMRWSQERTRFVRRARRYAFRIAKRVVRARTSAATTSNCSLPEQQSMVWTPQACIACKMPLGEPAGNSDTPMIVECKICGTGTTWPPPSRDVAGDGLFTERYSDSRLRRRDQWFLEARARLNWMQLHVPGGVLVEPGCATGEFLAEAEQSGFEAYGVEASRWAASQARELGVDVTDGFLSDWQVRFPAMHVDVLSMWHVLEHVPDPDTMIEEIIDVLRPGGMLFLEVPNFESSEAQRLGIEWDGAQTSDHVYHYTAEGVRRLLSRHGFTDIEPLQISARVYVSADEWQRQRNQALLDRRPWPPKDLLRVVARSPMPAPDSVESVEPTINGTQRSLPTPTR